MRQLALATMFLTVLAACAIPTHALPSQAGRAEGSFSRTLNVSDPVELDVTTGSGSIDIRQGAVGHIEIHGRIRAGGDWFRSSRDADDIVQDLEAHPPIEQSGNRIRIGRQEDHGWRNNVSISYEIVVPARASVRSHTGSGSQTIAGIEGPVETGTGSGSITLNDVRGRISARTGSGSIHADRIRGEFSAHTGSGSIRADGEQTGRWDLETGSGGVDVRLPQTAAFDLSAHTGSGGVTVDHPLTVQGRMDRHRRDVSGRVGGGGHALDVRTGSGHIRIE